MLFRSKMGEFTNRVLDSMPENERSKWVKKYHGNEQLAEEEYVARFAKGYENPNVWEKIKAAFTIEITYGFFIELLYTHFIRSHPYIFPINLFYFPIRMNSLKNPDVIIKIIG